MMPSDPLTPNKVECSLEKAEGSHKVYAVDLFEDGYYDSVYHAKACILSHALQDIGMGRYQWYLFTVTGFGWLTVGVWGTLSGLILTSIVNEFDVSPAFLSLAFSIGVLAGSLFWSIGCDIWGRRSSFNLTLLVTSVFGLAAGGSNDFVALATLFAILGVGIGGCVPVDPTVFLDFIPASHQYLMTTFSVWYSLGQLISSLVAWPLISNFSCATSENCEMSNNMGWRYLLFTFGGFTLLLWGLRFFAFPLLESPRYLSGIGRDAEATDIMYRLAKYNGRTTTLTVKELEAPGQIKDVSPSSTQHRTLPRNLAKYAGHIKALFVTPKLAWSTALLIVIFVCIGVGSTLYTSFFPYLLSTRDASFGDTSLYLTYRNQVIVISMGIPACILSGWTVEIPRLGRKGTLALFSGLSGLFLLASTTARTSNQYLAWNCAVSFFSNALAAVAYGIAPEIFPAKDRCTGNGLSNVANCTAGVLVPLIALYGNLATAVPIYVAGGLVFLAGILALALPYEPRGKASA